MRGATITAGLLGVALSSDFAAARPPKHDAPGVLECKREAVYGTVVVVDEDLGMFGLAGTRYAFLATPDVDLNEIEGHLVKIDVDSDCSVLGIEVIENREGGRVI